MLLEPMHTIAHAQAWWQWVLPHFAVNHALRSYFLKHFLTCGTLGLSLLFLHCCVPSTLAQQACFASCPRPHSQLAGQPWLATHLGPLAAALNTPRLCCAPTVHAGHNPICAGVTDVEVDIRLSDVAARLARAGIHVVAISVGDDQLDSPFGDPLGDCTGPAGGEEATVITTRTNGKLYSGIYTSTIVQVGGAGCGCMPHAVPLQCKLIPCQDLSAPTHLYACACR